MGYEEAPATKMLATNCCHCGRPLCDSDSVEAGLGPVCRAKLAAEPECNPNYLGALNLMMVRLPNEEFSGKVIAAIRGEDAHKAANLLTHHISKRMDSRSEASLRGEKRVWFPTVGCVAWMIHVIDVLGYQTLARTIAKRLYRVVVWRTTHYTVHTPYNDHFVTEMHAMRGQWDKVLKRYSVVLACREQLFQALKANYRGVRAFTPSGEYEL